MKGRVILGAAMGFSYVVVLATVAKVLGDSIATGFALSNIVAFALYGRYRRV
jgi:hypothetical protein